ncbi:hypothetical protein L9F63_015339 [Diploptera punctata]|uniref:beta-N-acetylhexosaminidase n=1 Tax=Diploptera punctata TaxID=6984 RepID=A0AAD8A5R2_DIPPU|nr:hypothetical protein L9F63_015339 [Diploptera punctata]
MWRIRGRTQMTIIVMTIATLILILYRMSTNDVAATNITKESQVQLDDSGYSTVPENIDQFAKRRAMESNILNDIKGHRKYEDRNQRIMFPNGLGLHTNENEVIHTDNMKQNSDGTWNNGLPTFKGARIVHLDLKGAPPRVSYYEEFFPLIRNLGATGVLIEYEDMFPFNGPLLQDLPAYNAYSISDIKRILHLAASNDLQVIPLIQTFGHLEFLLKLQRFMELREVQKYPQFTFPNKFCKSHRITVCVVHQIVALHPGIKYLHIGCDEVYYLGECVRCGLMMVDHQWSKKQLFLHHQGSPIRYIREKHREIVPLTWDDEFRDLSASELVEWGIPKLLEPVVWKYTPDVVNSIASEVWNKYAAVFPAVWIASAFKGATGSDKYITDISENHHSWMDIISLYSSQLKFKGIFITGWQRYDHFSVLCELLPIGIPSLASALAYIQSENRGMTVVPRHVLDLLKCDGSLPMSPGSGRTRCNFPGAEILEAVERLYLLQMNVDRMLADSTLKGWMTSYNIEHGFSSPSHVEHATAELDRCKMELTYIERDVRSAMSDVYDRYTISEWVSTFLRPLDIQLQTLWDAREKLLSRTHWPKRPLDILKPSSIAHNL